MKKSHGYFIILFAMFSCALYIYALQEMPTDGAAWFMDQEFVVIHGIDRGSEADFAGLRAGDTILTVGGRRAEVNFMVQSVVRYFSVGTLVDYVILRDGHEQIIPVTLQSMWSIAPRVYVIIYTLVFIVIFIGFIVLVRGPDSPDARVFFVFVQSFAISLNASPLGWTFVNYAMTIPMQIGLMMQGPSLIHFFLLFPHRHSLLARYPKLPVLLYFSMFLFLLIAMVTTLRWLSTYSPADERIVVGTHAIGLLWVGVTLTSGLALALSRFFKEKGFVGHNQLRWIMLGMLLGMVPGCVFSLFPSFTWSMIAANRPLFQLILTSSAILFVVFGSLALFKYRLWELEHIIRRGILYAVLTITVLGIYALFAYLLDVIIPSHTESLHLISLTAVTLLFIPLREALQRRIDLMFHREGYDPTRVLENFEFSLTGYLHQDQLVEKIARAIDEVFHFRTFMFYVKGEDGTFTVRAAAGTDVQPDELHRVAPHELTEKMKTANPVTIRELNSDEALLNRMNAAHLVPLTTGNEVLGLFVCGTKVSERSFSMEDIKLLSAIAKRTGSLLRTLPLYQRDQRAREEFTGQLIQSQETERRRIAGELHDGLGQYFIVILNRAKMLLRRSAEELPESDVNEIMTAASQGIDDVRKAAFNLSPYHIEQIGLKASIEAMMKRLLDGSEIAWVLDADDPGDLIQTESRIHVYRIVQECLNNIIKHAYARNVNVRITVNHAAATITVRDDGKGFDHKGISERNLSLSGFGLRGIAGRTKLLNGTLSVDSAIGRGTTVTVKFSQKATGSHETLNGAVR